MVCLMMLQCFMAPASILLNKIPQHSGFCTTRLHTSTIHSAYSRSLHWFAPPTITPPRCEVFDSMYNMFCHSGNV